MVSMLPVSGAEQLKASGAMGDRPMISQSGAYSRFVSPAPRSLSGRKRFQIPRSRALAFSSSMIGGICQRVGPAVSGWWETWSLGELALVVKSGTCSLHIFVFFLDLDSIVVPASFAPAPPRRGALPAPAG